MRFGLLWGCQDYTRPNMRYVAAESIAHNQILVTLQVDEGSRVWCAAWSTDPGITVHIILATLPKVNT